MRAGALLGRNGDVFHQATFVGSVEHWELPNRSSEPYLVCLNCNPLAACCSCGVCWVLKSCRRAGKGCN